MKTFAKMAVFTALSCSAFGLENWQNQEIIQLNTTEPRATFEVYESRSKALKGKPGKNEVLLNGTWKFQWSKILLNVL